jgi:membrane associated rhomboid family serine protease
MSSVVDNIRAQFKQGGMYIKLVYVNAAIFLLLSILIVVGDLMKGSFGLSSFVNYNLGVSTDLSILIRKPWTLITTMFVHAGFMHLLSNMLMLFFLGRIFEGYLGAKKTLSLYLMGGIVGALIQILAKNVFPLFADMPDYPIVGASGAVFAIAVGLTTYAPNLEVNLFGAFRVKLIYIVGALLALEFLRLSSVDGTAHFAHVGGGLFGLLSMYLYRRGTDILGWLDKLQDRFAGRKGKPRMKVKYSRRREAAQEEKPPRNDYDYNASKAAQQERLDKILDKIKYKGYDGLTKEEKEFLNRF